MQSTAIAADKVFIVWGKNLPFEEGTAQRKARGFMVDSSQPAGQPTLVGCIAKL
jgi:hypothetical protein